MFINVIEEKQNVFVSTIKRIIFELFFSKFYKIFYIFLKWKSRKNTTWMLLFTLLGRRIEFFRKFVSGNIETFRMLFKTKLEPRKNKLIFLTPLLTGYDILIISGIIPPFLTLAILFSRNESRSLRKSKKNVTLFSTSVLQFLVIAK